MSELAGRTVTARDRDGARLLGAAMVVWALIWTLIIVALFMYGGAISALVV